MSIFKKVWLTGNESLNTAQETTFPCSPMAPHSRVVLTGKVSKKERKSKKENTN